MLNPFESNGLYKKIEQIRRLKVTKSMLQSFRHCVKESEISHNRKDQPIKFYKYFKSQNDIYPKDDINYKNLMDYMLFKGQEYQYEKPGRFGRFFANILWNKDLKSSPLNIFNFVMNFPYLVYNFDKARGNRVVKTPFSSLSIKLLGSHFIPIFSGLCNSTQMQRLINKYYNKYHGISDCYDEQMLEMLKCLYSIEYEEFQTILELNCQNYFKMVLQHMCTFVNNTSNNDLKVVEKHRKVIKTVKVDSNCLFQDQLLDPDLVIFGKDDVAQIVIEMYNFPFFSATNVPEFREMMRLIQTSANGDTLRKNRFLEFRDGPRFFETLNQLLVYMIGYDCPRGILSDGYTVILVEIDIAKLNKKGNNVEINQIPIMMTMFDCRSVEPSYLQGILYFIMKVVLNPVRFDPNKLPNLKKLRIEGEIFRDFVGDLAND